METLSPADALTLKYDWAFWARPNQIAPPDDQWSIWMLLTGRGFGKTRSGAEEVRRQVEAGISQHIALVGATASDARDIMVEGPSGILSVSPPWFMPIYQPSKRRVVWPNGATATIFTSEEPERLRGPNHDLAWCDEIASWTRVQETWDNLMFGLRLGQSKCIVTSTPKPISLIKRLYKDTNVTTYTGSTYDNFANLSETYKNQIVKEYEGTRLGRQELMGEILDDIPGALWNLSLIDKARVKEKPDLVRVVVGVDPAMSANEHSNETGIVVAGNAKCKCKVEQGGEEEFHTFVLDDLSLVGSPVKWSNQVISGYDKWGGDKVVGEVNNGGDLVESVLRRERISLPFKAVRASRGKRVRAEPIAMMYERGEVHHVGGFPKLEDQMCSWGPDTSADDSPDRMDALVWAIWELRVKSKVWGVW